ncbi:tetratricopeptide repeat protein [Desulfobacterales bacterium HSG16]|nr:tetratricopeptide repeat protein [Desulfobacterales bacterium HSG16]
MNACFFKKSGLKNFITILKCVLFIIAIFSIGQTTGCIKKGTGPEATLKPDKQSPEEIKINKARKAWFEYYLKKGKNKEGTGNYKEALDYFKKARGHNYMNARADGCIARVKHKIAEDLFLQGKDAQQLAHLDQAHGFYESALSYNPNHEEAQKRYEEVKSLLSGANGINHAIKKGELISTVVEAYYGTTGGYYIVNYVVDYNKQNNGVDPARLKVGEVVFLPPVVMRDGSTMMYPRLDNYCAATNNCSESVSYNTVYSEPYMATESYTDKQSQDTSSREVIDEPVSDEPTQPEPVEFVTEPENVEAVTESEYVEASTEPEPVETVTEQTTSALNALQVAVIEPEPVNPVPDVNGILAEAKIFYNNGRYGEAIEKAEQALQIDPENRNAGKIAFDSHYGLAEFFLKKDDLPAAIEHFRRAQGKNEKCPDCRQRIKKCRGTYLNRHYSAGKQHYFDERFQEAIREFVLVRKMDSNYKSDITPDKTVSDDIKDIEELIEILKGGN